MAPPEPEDKERGPKDEEDALFPALVGASTPPDDDDAAEFGKTDPTPSAASANAAFERAGESMTPSGGVDRLIGTVETDPELTMARLVASSWSYWRFGSCLRSISISRFISRR